MFLLSILIRTGLLLTELLMLGILLRGPDLILLEIVEMLAINQLLVGL
jgi:hypothetical protein